MLIYFAKGLYTVEGVTDGTVMFVKGAHFRWHNPPKCVDCGACQAGVPPRTWWTNDERRVISMAVAISKYPTAKPLEFRDEELARKAQEAIEKAAGHGPQLSFSERGERDP